MGLQKALDGGEREEQGLMLLQTGPSVCTLQASPLEVPGKQSRATAATPVVLRCHHSQLLGDSIPDAGSTSLSQTICRGPKGTVPIPGESGHDHDAQHCRAMGTC